MQEKSEVSSIYYIPEILEISDRYVCLDVLTVLSIFLPCLVVVAFENGGRGTVSEVLPPSLSSKAPRWF